RESYAIGTRTQMERLLPIFALMFGLAGCAQVYWTKAGFSEAEWNRDRYECERDMRQSGYYGTGLVGALNAENFFEGCLVARGYYKTTAAASRPSEPDSAVPAIPPSSDVNTNPKSKKARIERLAQAREQGTITSEQYEEERAKIILAPDF